MKAFSLSSATIILRSRKKKKKINRRKKMGKRGKMGEVERNRGGGENVRGYVFKFRIAICKCK